MTKLFGGLKMRWLTVILSALAAGVYTGAVMLVPALKDTSFQDIGITYEWWVVFAVVIAVNSASGREAGLKCFVFFLISQPVVYLVEILSGSLTFDLAKTYYLSMWLPLTVATLPGGLAAYYSKKQNVAGGIILGLGNTIELLLGIYYLKAAVTAFPRHILSAVFCIAAAVAMTLCIQRKKAGRLAAFIVPVILVAGIFVFAKMTGRTFI